ncbi:MAG: DUF1624 domain-containing protein [Oscillospiraceae bacterium]|nr:DUF1624 domain-containing protein [Oscillospiraceae bacterium]
MNRPTGPRRRYDSLDAWRSLAVVLMLAYHFLFDLYIFGVITREQLFCTPLNIMQKFICCSFILLAGVSARFTRSNLRHGLTVLAAGVVVEIGAAVGGQTIRFGVLMFLGTAMLLYHVTGRSIERLPALPLTAVLALLFWGTSVWTNRVRVTVPCLYPLGLMTTNFYSADYFPIMPWLFLFLAGTVLGGVCRRYPAHPLLTVRLPKALTWLGRHSLLIYILHQPVLFGITYLIWG